MTCSRYTSTPGLVVRAPYSPTQTGLAPSSQSPSEASNEASKAARSQLASVSVSPRSQPVESPATFIEVLSRPLLTSYASRFGSSFKFSPPNRQIFATLVFSQFSGRKYRVFQRIGIDAAEFLVGQSREHLTRRPDDAPTPFHP